MFLTLGSMQERASEASNYNNKWQTQCSAVSTTLRTAAIIPYVWEYTTVGETVCFEQQEITILKMARGSTLVWSEVSIGQREELQWGQVKLKKKWYMQWGEDGKKK